MPGVTLVEEWTVSDLGVTQAAFRGTSRAVHHNMGRFPFLTRYIRQKPTLSQEIINRILETLQAFFKIAKTVPGTHPIIHGIMPIIL